MRRIPRLPVRRRSTAASAAFALVLALLAGPATAVTAPTEPSGEGTDERFATPLPIPAEYTEADIELVASEAEVEILEGEPTRMWTFDGSFPGPTIRRPAGEPTRVTVRNELPAEAGSLTIHNHGNHSASEHDGRPEFPIERGHQFTYVYDLVEDGEPQRGALQWYHDHTHHVTGRNVWMGLAGMFIVEHPDEEALGLPSGEHDVPLMITDRAFDDDNQLVTDGFTAHERHDAHALDTVGGGWPPFDEVTGDVHLVNGAARPHFDVEGRRYRLRILNASNFRPYNLSLSTGEAMVQVATEGGLLPEPVAREAIHIGPAERAEVVIDFSGREGERIVLASTPADDAGLLGATGAASAELMEFRVGPDAPDDSTVPDVLRPLPDWLDEAAESPDRVWTFGLNPDEHGHSSWTINGRSFSHGRVDARVEIDSVETWKLVNTSPPGFSHYIHLHHTDWVLLSRNGNDPEPWEAGPKETFRLDPGDEIVIAARFSDHLGPYMLHCHMLEHEDHGMMANFEVVPAGEGDTLPVNPEPPGLPGVPDPPDPPGVPDPPDPPDPGLPDGVGPVVLAPPLAQANGFLPNTVVSPEGSEVTFANFDQTIHDVTAVDRGPDNQPLFRSALIGYQESAPVEGTADLAPGTYAFICSIHPGMKGDLIVP